MISKFTYLQSLLEGEAKAVIRGLAITSDNYPIACKLLEDRFGCREKIIFAHIQGLLNVTMPPMSGSSGKTSRIPNLWKLQDKLLSPIRSLEAMGVKGDEYGIFLTPVILSRLPHDSRMEWSHDGERHKCDLSWLLEFLRKEITRHECDEAFKEVTTTKTPDRSVTEERRSSNRPTNLKVLTASALQTASTSDRTRLLCGFCVRGHPTERCWDVSGLTIPECHDRILSAKLCFRCLGKNHVAKGCLAKCSHCNGKHHKLCCKLVSGNKDASVSDKEQSSNHANGSNIEKGSVSNVTHVGVASSVNTTNVKNMHLQI